MQVAKVLLVSMQILHTIFIIMNTILPNGGVMCHVTCRQRCKMQPFGLGLHPLAVETYGCWEDEAIKCLDRLKSSAASALYGRLVYVFYVN